MAARQKETVHIHRLSLAQQSSELSAQTYSRLMHPFREVTFDNGVDQLTNSHCPVE